MLALLLILLNACQTTKRHDSGMLYENANKTKIFKSQYDLEINKSHQELIITNLFGEIFVRKTDEPFVGVISTTQVFGKHAPVAEIKTQSTEHEIFVSINYPPTILATYQNNKKQIGRVDLVVFVPENLLLNLETSYGEINIKELDNNLKLTTQTGTIKTSGKGIVEIDTDSGNVYCNLLLPNWNNQTHITSESGNIFMTFPNEKNLKIKARSGKKIYNNFNAKIISANGVYNYSSNSSRNPISIISQKGFIKLVSVEQNIQQVL
jgi:DUF4097 and DUF4098 domain-containing protein YvlB